MSAYALIGIGILSEVTRSANVAQIRFAHLCSISGVW